MERKARAHDIVLQDFAVYVSAAAARADTGHLHAARFAERALVHAPGSLTFESGHLHAVIGPNGAGKTSLLRGMAGVLPAAGQMHHGDIRLDRLAPWVRTRTLGYQPQQTPRADGLRVDEFVLAARGARAPWLRGFSAHDLKLCDDALELAEVRHLAGRLVATLSGGETARVMLASTLAMDTPWLLLDEPGASLDAAGARSLYRLLRSLARVGQRSIVIVEHDLGMARAFAETATLIAEGEVRVSGPIESTFASANLELAYGTAFHQTQVGADAWAVVAIDERSPRIHHAGGAR